MPSRPWFPFYPSDYLTDTEDLSVEAHGLYILLLCRLWKAGGKLPFDRFKLSNKCRLNPRTYTRIWRELESYFLVENGELSHRRLSTELAKCLEKSRKARQAVQTRWGTDVPTDVPTDVIPPQPQPQPQSEKKNNNSVRNEFERWWLVYPKKVKKKTAFNTWQRKQLHKKTDLLIADTTIRIENDDRWERGYIPDPTTYLTQERWEDELS